jgi:hypothetical protein
VRSCVVCPVAEERVFGAGHMAEQRGPGRRVMRTRRGSDAAAGAGAGCRGIGRRRPRRLPPSLLSHLCREQPFSPRRALFALSKLIFSAQKLRDRF